MVSDSKIGVIGMVVIVMLTAFYAGEYQSSMRSLGTGVQNPAAANEVSLAAGNQTVTLTASEVSKHNTRQDCWAVMNGKVYDLTSYIPVHPGGAGRIVPYCGSDAAEAFATKGGKGSHSQSAYKMLDSLYIGDLNSEVTVPSIPSPVATGNFNLNGNGYEDEDEQEWEDDENEWEWES